MNLDNFSQNFFKKKENIQKETKKNMKSQWKIKTKISKMKNTLEEINSISDKDDQISDLKNRVAINTQSQESGSYTNYTLPFKTHAWLWVYLWQLAWAHIKAFL